MSTIILKEPEVQRQTQRDPSVPERLAGNFIWIRYNMATAVQRLPEMSDDEVLLANQGKGGFDWLNDPSEDVY